MLGAGYLTLRPVPATAAGGPCGPAATTLTAVAARTASAIRAVALAYVVIQVIIWHAFYAADPWRLAGPALAAASMGTVLAALRWHRAGSRLVIADSAVQVILALGLTWCLPPAMHGDSSSWLYVALASQVPVPAWFAPTRISAPLVIVTAAAYWAGAARGPAASSPAASAAMLAGLYLIAWWGLRMMSRRAITADASLARADAEAREQFVALSRSTERREHERLLHDTVLNTLTALARHSGGATDVVLARCRHDVALMESMLGEASDLHDPARQGDGGLSACLDAVASELRACGLIVYLSHERDLPDGGDPLPPIPARVAVAMARAVREALTNVAAHAGTGQAWVRVSLIGHPPGTVQVTVRDAGTGFDPASVDPDRLGLRRSIVERAADWGGRAAISSAPGEGTVISLYWPASAPDEAAAPW
jgi:signal transduction histidine kinase